MFINSAFQNNMMVQDFETTINWYKKAISRDKDTRDLRYFMSLLKKLPTIDQNLFYNLYFRKLALRAYNYTIKFPDEYKPSSTELQQLAEMKTRWQKASMHSLIDTVSDGLAIGLSAVDLEWSNTQFGNMVTTKRSREADELDIHLDDDELIRILDTNTETQDLTISDVDENTMFYVRYNPIQGFCNDFPGSFIRINWWLCLIKYWDLFNWSKGNQTSMVVANYEARFKSQLNSIMASLKNIGEQSVGAFEKGIDVKMLEQLNQAQVNSHKDLENYVDTQVTLTIAGQTTAGNPDSNHSYAASKVGFQIAKNVTYADLMYAEHEISTQYLMHDYLANYSEPRNAYPILEFKKFVVGDAESRGRLISDYVANGIPVHAEDMYDSVGLKRAIEDDVFVPNRQGLGMIGG